MKLLIKIKYYIFSVLAVFLFSLTANVIADSLTIPKEELFGFLGSISNNRHEHDKAWGAEYIQSFGRIPAISVAYLNEGHFDNHFRDGIALQFLVRFYPLTNTILSAGIGPYFYSDTVFYDDKTNYANRHRIALNYSLAATYDGFNPVLLKLGFNHVQAFNSINTNTFLFGLGYQLDGAKTPTTHVDMADNDFKNQITALLGQTTVNSTNNEHSIAYEIEYRRHLMPYVDVSLNWLDEGSNKMFHRNGIATEIWLTNRFFGDSFKLALGIGPYLAFTNRQKYENDFINKKALSGIVSIDADYFINSRWLVNATWNRIVTSYNRDTDMFLLGLGYRF